MKLDPKKTTLLTLDFQKGILAMVPGSDSVVQSAARAVEFARKKQYQIIHVGLGFAAGHPEIPDTQVRFARLKQSNLFVRGDESTEIHSAVARPEDLVVYKHRVSAFSENNLEMILRAHGTENLVFFGISTSGITLSTIRRAFDLDFKCVVLKDACFDPDDEVHRILTEKIFPNQAAVYTVDSFLAEQA